jgi:hypothetical protein
MNTDVFEKIASNEEHQNPEMAAVAKANILSQLTDCKQLLTLCKDERFQHVCHAPDQNQITYDGHVFKKFAEYNKWIWIPENMNEFEEICEYYSTLFWGDRQVTTLTPQESETRWKYVKNMEREFYDMLMARLDVSGNYGDLDDLKDLPQLDNDQKIRILSTYDWDDIANEPQNKGRARSFFRIGIPDLPITNGHFILFQNDDEFSLFTIYGCTESLFNYIVEPFSQNIKYFVQNITKSILRLCDGVAHQRILDSFQIISSAAVLYGTSDRTDLKNIAKTILQTRTNTLVTYCAAQNLIVALYVTKNTPEHFDEFSFLSSFTNPKSVYLRNVARNIIVNNDDPVNAGRLFDDD